MKGGVEDLERSDARCNELRICTCCTTSTTPDHVPVAICSRIRQIMPLLHLLQKPDAHKHKLIRLNHLLQSHTTSTSSPSLTPLPLHYFEPTSCQCALISRIMSNFSRNQRIETTQGQMFSSKRRTSGIAA